MRLKKYCITIIAVILCIMINIETVYAVEGNASGNDGSKPWTGPVTNRDGFPWTSNRAGWLVYIVDGDWEYHNDKM